RALSHVQPSRSRSQIAFCSSSRHPQYRRSFPTRRSSDLVTVTSMTVVSSTQLSVALAIAATANPGPRDVTVTNPGGQTVTRAGGDRKSTRLNSSHVSTSYAVFCLKKKKRSPTRNRNRHPGLNGVAGRCPRARLPCVICPLSHYARTFPTLLIPPQYSPCCRSVAPL